MIAWWVIIILVVVNVLSLIANLRFVYYYMHSDDLKYTQGIIAQIVCIVGAQFLWFLLGLYPTDVYNASIQGGLHILFLWQMCYLFVLVYLTLCLPFGVFYYQADSDPRITRSPAWRQALIKTAVTCAVSWAVLGVLYAICHKTDTGTTLDFLNFLLAAPAIFGWIVFAILGSIGIASMPIAIIYSFIKRPQPMSLREFEERKITLGERATTLKKVGERLQDQQKFLFRSNAFYYGGSQIKFRNMLAKYKQVVSLLEEEHRMLVESYKKRGANPLVAYFKLTAGVICAIVSVCWVFQIFWEVLIPQMTKRPQDFHFLAELMKLTLKSKILVPDICLYTLLCAYLLIGAVVGSVKLSARLQGWLPVEALRKQDTHLDTLLSLLALTILMVTAIIQLSYETLKNYGAMAEIHVEFERQETDYKLFKFFYGHKIFVWIFVVLSIFSAAWFIAFPKTRPAFDLDNPKTLAKWAKLQQDLGVDPTEAGAVQVDEELLAAANQKEQQQPNLAERAQARMQRIDHGIEGAPNALMGVGLRTAMM